MKAVVLLISGLFALASIMATVDKRVEQTTILEWYDVRPEFQITLKPFFET
jgi:hypothetical protein